MSLLKTSSTSKKQNEYQKAYSMIYNFTDNKKLQDKLFEYLTFRADSCKEKCFKFYSSCIKSFLDDINTKMGDATDDEVWDAINLTLSYPCMHLLVPYSTNKQSNVKSIECFKSPDTKTDGLDHTKSNREF